MSREKARRFLEADVKCYHCGRTVGAVRREDGQERSTFQLGRSGPETAVSSLTDLRCPSCQGPLFTDEIQVVYDYPILRDLFEPPRRGRPPKRLAQQRAQRSA
jgi:hypothetical protein